MKRNALALLAANLVTLVATFAMGGDLGWLLWPFWIQSVVIGWYAGRRMLALRDFSTEGFTAGGERVPENAEGKRSTVAFFAMHYGFFHLGYLVFLCSTYWPGDWRDIAVLVACGFSFAFAQRRTFAAQVARDAGTRPNLGRMMFLPYVRVVPMHAMVFAAGALAGPAAMVLATVLKTAADVMLDWLDGRPSETRDAMPAQ